MARLAAQNGSRARLGAKGVRGVRVPAEARRSLGPGRIRIAHLQPLDLEHVGAGDFLTLQLLAIRHIELSAEDASLAVTCGEGHPRRRRIQSELALLASEFDASREALLQELKMRRAEHDWLVEAARTQSGEVKKQVAQAAERTATRTDDYNPRPEQLRDRAAELAVVLARIEAWNEASPPAEVVVTEPCAPGGVEGAR